MTSRTVKLLTLALALALALPVVASASTSRVEGMALQGDYIKDYTNIYTFPSQVCCVGNLVYGELGNELFRTFTTGPEGEVVVRRPETLDRSVGAVLGNLWDGRYGVIAIHLREETPALGQGDAFSQPGTGVTGIDPNEHTNEAFDLMWAKKFGKTSLGLRFNRSFYKATDELNGVTTTLKFDLPLVMHIEGDPNLARNILGVGAGVGFELNPETSVDLSVLFQNRTWEDSETGSATPFKDENDGPTTYMIAGRAMWQWQPNVVVVPLFKYYSFDLSTKSTSRYSLAPPRDTTLKTDNTLTGWQAGIAGNWTLGTNDLFVLGVTFAQNKLKQQYDLFGLSSAAEVNDTLEVTETFSPQVFAALETHVNSWLTLRFGANKGVFHSIKLEEVGAIATRNETLKQNDSPFEMMLGAGVKLGTLQLDAIVSDQFPQTLGWVMSGDAQHYFPKVTATYSF